MMEDSSKSRSLLHRLNRRLLEKSLRLDGGHSGQFITRRYRPKSADDVGTNPRDSAKLSTAPVLRCEPAAIVMQGPVWPQDDFTYQTLRVYADHMPDCRLILSTWTDLPPEDRDRFERAGVEVVLSEKPDQAGIFNVNMQVTSAAAGMKRAAELGVDWVLKTRTDQRLYHPETMSGLAAIAKSLPPTGAACDLQKHRIFGVGHGSLKFAPYHLSDQTVFGHMDDMLQYWTPPLRMEGLPASWPDDMREVYATTPIRAFCRHAAAESYLTSQFLQRLGRPLTWTLEDSWKVFADHLGVVDYGATDFYWVKTQNTLLREETIAYKTVYNRRELTFLEWMQLYSNQLRPEDAHPFEHVLETPFTKDVMDMH